MSNKRGPNEKLNTENLELRSIRKIINIQPEARNNLEAKTNNNKKRPKTSMLSVQAHLQITGENKAVE